jgi:hypothetical protein
MKTISQRMISMIERLAEMFPGATYQSRLEHYLSQYHIDNAGQLEHLQRNFDANQARSFL